MFKNQFAELRRVRRARIILALLSTVAACSPDSSDDGGDDTPTGPSAPLTGQVIFWTRSSQGLPVNIWLDGTNARRQLGTSGPAPAPECSEADGLVVTLEEGNHAFIARGSTKAFAVGEVTVLADQCTAVEIVLGDERLEN